jgi:hypothetical protein
MVARRDVVRFGAGGAGSHGQGARNVVVAVPAVFGSSWRTPQNLDFFFSKRDRAVYLEFLCAPCNSEHHRVRRRAGTEYARPAASASEWHWQSKAIHSHICVARRIM